MLTVRNSTSSSLPISLSTPNTKSQPHISLPTDPPPPSTAPPPPPIAVVQSSPADHSMAEVAGRNPPSLSEQYLLPKEEKVSKPVEEVKVERPVSVETPAEEVVPEGVEAPAKEVIPEEVEAPVKEVIPEEVEAPVAAEEGNEAPAEAATDSSDAPINAAENSSEESTDAVEEQTEETEEASEETPEVKLETAPADFRFPTTNQTRHCFTRYIEYHRCIAAKGEDAPECNRFAKYYRSLCPGEWVDRWNEQRENGTFPGPL